MADAAVVQDTRRNRKSEAQTEQRRRKWEELDPDCLTNVFSRVGMESLLLHIPFVCKSWYEITLNPLSWKNLDFPDYVTSPLFGSDVDGPQSFGSFYDKFIEQYRIDANRFSITSFVKFVVDNSNGKATYLLLPEFCEEQVVRYVMHTYPLLETLWLKNDLLLFKSSQIIPEMICKWKFLQCLHLGGNLITIVEQFLEIQGDNMISKHFESLLTVESPLCYTLLDRLLVQIVAHCKDFKALVIYGAPFSEVNAFTMVNQLPGVKLLILTSCFIGRDSFVAILRGCKELVVFQTKYCLGFEQSCDEEISKLAMHIDTFIHEDCARSSAILNMYRIMRNIIFWMSNLANDIMED